jgi:hypothetical protein
MAAEQLTVNGITIDLVRKNIKNLHLRVYPPHGQVRVSAPLHASKAAVTSVIVARLDWIRQQQARLAQLPAPVQPPCYQTGESHYFQGRAYLLNVIDTAGRAKVMLRDNMLELYVRPDYDSAKRKKVLEHWYRQQLSQQIPALIAKWQPVMAVEVADWGIKQMRTRWGTCNTRDRRIWLALALAQKPPRCLEYVVVHEMVHLLERSHNARFQAFMTRFLPDWRQLKQQLNSGADAGCEE